MLFEYVCGGELFSYLRNAGRFNGPTGKKRFDKAPPSSSSSIDLNLKITHSIFQGQCHDLIDRSPNKSHFAVRSIKARWSSNDRIKISSSIWCLLLSNQWIWSLVQIPRFSQLLCLRNRAGTRVLTFTEHCLPGPEAREPSPGPGRSPEDHRFRIRQEAEGPHLDSVRDSRVSRPRNHPVERP